MNYRFCSICGGSLAEKNGNLACECCPFVNYRNPRPTVTALVLNGDKLLLTKRGREPFKGFWDLPGGFMDRGEASIDALRRELKEEAGLEVKNEEFFGIYPGTYPSDFDPFHILSIVYLIRTDKNELKALDDVVESRWFKISDVPEEIAFDSNQKIVKDFKTQWS